MHHALILAAFLLLAARAVSGDDEPPYSMPFEKIFPDEVLSREFEYRKSVPFGDSSLALALPCRTSWKWIEVKSDTKSSYDRMVLLAVVQPPDDPEIQMEMSYLQLRQEVKLEDWVDWFLDAQEMRAVQGRVGEYHDRHTVDAVVEYRDADGGARVGRVAFFKNADRIYMTAGSAPRAKYEKYAREFGVAATGATPQKLSTAEFAEELKEHRFDAPCKISFKYPASWAARAADAPGGVGAVDLFQGDAASPKGLIKVRVYSRTKIPGFSLEKATWSVLEELKGASPDLELKDKLQEMEASTDAFPEKGKMTVYSISLGGAPAELHELVLANKDTVLAVALVTATKEKAPLTRLVNRRAWEIVGMKLELGAK